MQPRHINLYFNDLQPINFQGVWTFYVITTMVVVLRKNGVKLVQNMQWEPPFEAL